jgi:hypothetical protein
MVLFTYSGDGKGNVNRALNVLRRDCVAWKTHPGILLIKTVSSPSRSYANFDSSKLDCIGIRALLFNDIWSQEPLIQVG